jgi:hypothetical protein
MQTYVIRKLAERIVIACFIAAMCRGISIGQESSPFSTVGIGVKASLLGLGGELATPLSHGFNLRGGFNAFGYDRTFHKDGIGYDGRLHFRSGEAHLDWFPFHGSFHLSPGALFYNGNQVAATAAVPGGQTFTLNGVTYMSDASNPVGGAGKIAFKRSGPMLSVGFGNLVSRRHRFTIPIEIGAIYTGAPNMTLNLAGSACDTGGANCSPIASTPAIQSNIQAEQAKINKDMSAFKFYPVISIGFGVKL